MKGMWKKVYFEMFKDLQENELIINQIIQQVKLTGPGEVDKSDIE